MNENDLLKNFAKLLGPGAEEALKATEEKQEKEKKLLESIATSLGPEAKAKLQAIEEEQQRKQRAKEEKKERERKLLETLNASLLNLISDNPDKIEIIEQEVVEAAAEIPIEVPVEVITEEIPQTIVEELPPVAQTPVEATAANPVVLPPVPEYVPAGFRKELDIVKKTIQDLHRLIARQSSLLAGASHGGGEVNLRYLDDVDRTTIADGLFLMYDAASKKFVFTEGGGGSGGGPRGYTGSQGPIGYSGSIGGTGYTGSSGYTGSIGGTGYTGSEGGIGFTGSQGDQGPTGYDGSQGLTGYTGSGGLGYTGSSGVGYTGSAGTDGIVGYNGSVGFTGSAGIDGYTGSAGAGYTGSTGYTGSIGSSGYTGSQGSTGPLGPQGSTGYTGSRGYTGSVGSTGFTGSFGYSGSQGDLGYTGSFGNTGYTGSIGYTGSQGIQGTTGYTGSFGNIGYTGSTGVGYTGSIGYTGSAATISATINQTFTGDGTSNSFNITGGYIPNSLVVFLNGVKQVDNVDVSITSGSSVTFTVPPANNYIVDVFGYQANNITYQQAQVDWNQSNTSAVDYIKNKPTINGIVHPTYTVTASTYAISNADYYVGVNYAANVTLSLPGTAISGKGIIIKDESGNCVNNPITVSGTVDNDPTGFILTINNGGIHMLYNNGSWRII
jgi:hypothetical protein